MKCPTCGTVLPSGQAALPLRGEGPLGWGVSASFSDPSSSGSDPDPISNSSTRDPSATEQQYDVAFELIWVSTGRRGIKFRAFRAWKRVGRPSWERISYAWEAYLLSDRPVRGFTQDLSTWLNGRGHTQSWKPARQTNGAAHAAAEQRDEQTFMGGRRWAGK